MTDLQEKFAAKIAKLLALAESTKHPAEAETFITKAQELMAQYAVEQAMIDRARGIERDEIEQRKIYFTGNYRQELLDLAWAITRNNNCLGVQWQTTHDDGGRKAVRAIPQGDGTFKAQVTSRKKALCLEVTGFRADIERVLLLESSLRLQAMTSMTRWWQQEGKPQYDWETYAHKVRIRGEFMESFVAAVSAKLRAAKQTGEQAAVKTEAERTSTTESEAGESVALVLRSRKDQVKDWYDARYGKLGKSRRTYKQNLSGQARNAGYSAGQRADVGQSSLRGRKGLNR